MAPGRSYTPPGPGSAPIPRHQRCAAHGMSVGTKAGRGGRGGRAQARLLHACIKQFGRLGSYAQGDMAERGPTTVNAAASECGWEPVAGERQASWRRRRQSRPCAGRRAQPEVPAPASPPRAVAKLVTDLTPAVDDSQERGRRKPSRPHSLRMREPAGPQSRRADLVRFERVRASTRMPASTRRCRATVLAAAGRPLCSVAWKSRLGMPPASDATADRLKASDR